MYLVVPPGGCFPETRRIELGPGALTIGRAEACEIRVDVPGVDEEHAKISEVALIALGPDCAIGDVPLDQGSRRLLMPGDEIQIGSVVVALEGDDPSIPPPRQDGAPNGTQKMGGFQLEGPRVRVVEGSNFGDELLMKEEGREYLIGRGATCDLVLDDREVSREHVKVMRRGYSVYVQDLSSTRGSWLGRAAVYTGATVEWSRPRMMRVGATVLSLELPDEIRRRAPGPQASSPMTPPPRSRGKAGLEDGSHGSDGSSPGGSVGAPGSHTPSSPPVQFQSGHTDPMIDKRAVGLPGPHRPDPTPTPRTGASTGMTTPNASPSAPRGLGSLPPPSHSRKAWKKTGPTIGKASGLLLLALAGLVILGGLFIVFSMME